MIAPHNNKPTPKHKMVSLRWLAYIGLALALAGGSIAILFLFRPRGDIANIHEEDSKGQIVEVIPSATVPAQVEEKVETARERALRKINEGIYTDERGVRRYANGARVPVKPDVVVDLRNLKERKFSFASERQIADVLMIVPGERLIGEIRYGEAFEEDFKNSLTNRIEIYDDDSAETKELKQAVIDTKLDLADRMRNGESVAEIMAQARKEAQDIAAYRADIESQVKELVESGDINEKDEQDLYDAANLMLEQRGAKPLRIPSTLIKQLREYMKAKKDSTL